MPLIRADPDRLTQVMLNLLSNAAKFVPAEGGRVEVVLRTDADGLVVEVRDNGPGVPAAEQATVFEKFRQGGDAAEPAAGDGTGPSDQPPDRRSFRRAHVAGIGTGRGRVLRIPAAAPADGGQGRTMSHKVLIADDEPNIVVSLEFLMKREGYEVVVARDGQQALEAIRRERPQLVLLDAMMPGMTGFDVCEAVRADEAVRDTRILMLTAKGRDTDVAAGPASAPMPT